MYYVYASYGLLHDVNSEDRVLINPKLDFELNKAATFEFTMAPNHPCYDDDCYEGWLSPFNLHYPVTVLQDDEVLFQGRVTDIQVDMNKNKTFYCESVLAYLNDSIQRPAEYHLEGNAVYRYLDALLAEHNNQVHSPNAFFSPGVVTIDDPNDYIYCYTNYNSTLEELKEDLVDDYGGYFRIRTDYDSGVFYLPMDYYVDYIPLDEYGNRNTQTIEFGENLLDYVSNRDRTDVFTCLIPLGATQEESEFSGLDVRLTIESVNGGSDYLYIEDAVQAFGYIYKTVVWDDITEAKNLLAAGEKYLQEYDWDSIVIEATAVDMHLTDEQIMSFRLGDMVHVISEPHGLDQWFPISQMTVYLDQPENNSVTLGTFEDISLTARTNEVSTGLRNMEDFQVGNVIASAVAQATAIINSAMHGYVTLHLDEDEHPYELLIMDAPEIDDAKKLWRWNMGGLGYSKDGYEGPYGLAMTMDGRILGNFITAAGMVLANDTEANFGKFDYTGMKIFQQQGREDLLLMSVGELGMMLYDDTGMGLLASFDSEAVTFYSSAELQKQEESGYGTSIEAYGTMTRRWTNMRSAVSVYNVYNDNDYLERSGYRTLEENVDYTLEYGINKDVVGDGMCPYATVTNLTDSPIYVMIKMSAIYYEDTDLYKNMQLDGQGLRVYDANGTIRSNMTENSFTTYDDDGESIISLNQNGLRVFDSNETTRALFYREFIGYNDANGTRRIDLNTQGLYFSNSNGNYVVGLNSQGVACYNDGNLIGNIGANYLQPYPSEYGLTFDLEYSDDYMSFAHRDSANASVYTIKFAYYASSCSYPEGVAFGDNTRMNNYKLYLHDSNSGGYFWAVNSSDGGFYGGDFYFDGAVYSNGTRLTTLADTVSVMLTANGEESEGELSFYSGMKLDVSDLVDYKSSDETLKTSIQPLNGARVDNITPVTFKWKSGDNTAHYGYIAQEVREHIPEIVKENDDGLLSLAYTEIIPLLHAKINTLEERIAKLEEIIYGKEKE